MSGSSESPHSSDIIHKIIFVQGLGALAKERPENPIEFLAKFLMKEKHRYEPSNEGANAAGNQ